MNKRRFLFISLFLMLLVTEFVIGLFIHDNFVRPYLGDVLIVILLYSFIRIFLPKKFPYVSLIVLLIAVLVELTQLIPLVDFLGIKNSFLRALMGTSFSKVDLLCYSIGILPLLPYDIYLFMKDLKSWKEKRKEKKKKKKVKTKTI